MADDYEGEGDAEFMHFMQQEAENDPDNLLQQAVDASNENLYTGFTDEEALQYLQDAAVSGVDTKILDKTQSGWGLVKDGFKSISSWVKDNPEISKMALSGVGTAMRQKNDRESLELKNQFDIERESRKNARDDALWERKNQSIIGMQPAGLGIVGKAMYDSHIDYLKNRK